MNCAGISNTAQRGCLIREAGAIEQGIKARSHASKKAPSGWKKMKRYCIQSRERRVSSLPWMLFELSVRHAIDSVLDVPHKGRSTTANV
jgi:hypothetical protein